MSESSFRSPFTALVWKEWRESWWVLILMVTGPAMLYFAATALVAWQKAANRVSTDAMLSLPVFALWALALFLGAGLFAGERARRTSAFQSEQPVARGTIWNAKFLMPAAALVSGAILFPLLSLWLRPPQPVTDGILPLMFVITAFLAFASAALCSAVCSRPITAWAAGAVLVFGQAAVFDIFIGGNRHPDTSVTLPLFLCVLTLEAFGLLWLSRVLYVRRGAE